MARIAAVVIGIIQHGVDPGAMLVQGLLREAERVFLAIAFELFGVAQAHRDSVLALALAFPQRLGILAQSS